MRNGEYELIVAPDNYPGMIYRGHYAYEHSVVWWQNTGQLPKSGNVIHHINENKRDNRFINLEEMSVGDHNRHHTVPALTTELRCPVCAKLFTRQNRDLKMKKKAGYKNFYCGRSCQVTDQQRLRRIGTYHKGNESSC